MKAFRLLAIVGTVFMIAFLGGCANKGGKVVAKVGDKQITVRDVEKNFQRAQEEFAFLGDDLESKRKFVQEVVNKELLAMEARTRSMDKDDRVVRAYKKAERELLLSKLYEDEVVQKTNVSRNNLEDELDRLREERYIYQIKVPTEEEAKEIVELLKQGGNFEELARTRSVLPNVEQGGLDGWGWRGKYAKPFDEAAFSVKVGGFSDVVKTVAGYHVIKVTDVRKVDLGTLEENRARLENSVRERKKKEREQQYMESLTTKYELKFQDENIAFLFEKIQEEHDPAESPYLPKFLGLGDEKKVLATYTGAEMTIADYIKHFTESPPLFRTTIQNEEHLKAIVNSMATDRLLDMEADRHGYAKEEEVKERLARKLEELMVSALYEDEVLSTILLTEEDVKAYYEQHPDLFNTAEMVSVSILTFPRKADAEQFYQDVQGGANYDSLRRECINKRIAVDESTRGPVMRGQNPEFDDTFFSMQVGDVAGPVKTEGGYKVFKLTEKAEKSPMTWEQAQNYADQKLRGDKAEEALVLWLEDLKGKHGAEIYEESLGLVSLKPKKK